MTLPRLGDGDEDESEERRTSCQTSLAPVVGVYMSIYTDSASRESRPMDGIHVSHLVFRLGIVVEVHTGHLPPTYSKYTLRKHDVVMELK